MNYSKWYTSVWLGLSFGPAGTVCQVWMRGIGREPRSATDISPRRQGCRAGSCNFLLSSGTGRLCANQIVLSKVRRYIYIYRHALRLMCFWCGTEILKLRCSLLVRGSHQLCMFPGAARSVGVWTHFCHRSRFGVVKSNDQHMQPDGQPQEALPKCPDDCSWKYFCTVGLCLVIGLLVLVPSGLQLGSGQ